MSVFWRIHRAIARDREKEIIAVLRGLDAELDLISGVFSDQTPGHPSGAEEAGIALTTLQDASLLLSGASGRWQYPRILYFDKHKYDVSYWMPLISEDIPVLNRGCLFVPAGCIKHMKTTMEDLKNSSAMGLFVRPDSGLKSFTGFVLPVTPTSSWEDVSAGIFKAANPSGRTMLCLSPATSLAQTEWRFWIADRRVVASSPYSWDGPIRGLTLSGTKTHVKGFWS